VLKDVAQGRYQLVFFTLEMLIDSKKWRMVLEEDLYAERMRALVIDEVHCFKKW